VLALVIDTSSVAVTAGLASYDDRSVTVLAAQVAINGRGHAELLAPAIRTCLGTAGLDVGELDAVVVGLGPGPFTGLRVGLVTAAAFADAAGLPAYGVCSLDAIAADCEREARDLLVAGDARRKEVYWARYLDGVRIGEPAVGKPAELGDGAAVMAGAGARLYADVLGLTLLEHDYPSVAGLAACAGPRVIAGLAGEVLQPLYLRRPDAVEPVAVKTVSQ
jgi:tRNA threonylcarbamoyl adenosine modification protein YeaZ